MSEFLKKRIISSENYVIIIKVLNLKLKKTNILKKFPKKENIGILKNVLIKLKNFKIQIFYMLEMPLEKLPVLEVDGVKIGESLAICRYIGKEYGLFLS